MKPDLADLSKNNQVSEATSITLRPYQYDFVYNIEKWVAFVGAWATGKSMCLILRALLYAQEIPNNLIYILRREWVDLKDSTIKDFEQYTGLTVGSNRNVSFPNGSVIMFRHIEELNKAGKNLQNINLGAFFIEQAEELPTDREFFILQGRLRRKVNPTNYFKSLGLADHTGTIIANVSGNNWIKQLWKDPKEEGLENKDFPLIEAVTADNYINLVQDYKDTLESLKVKKPEIYNRYCMNDWSAEVEGRVFRNIDSIIAGSFIDPQPGFDYIIGADFAKTHDFNVATVMNRQTKHIDYVERWNNTSWNLTQERFAAISKKYNNALMVADSTGVGDPIVEDLQRAGVRIFYTQKKNSEITTPGVKFNATNKEQIIEKLQVSIEQGLITIPQYEIMIDELRNFECIMQPSRKYTYNAPVGKHDDCVISLALATWGLWIYAEDYVPPAEITRASILWDRVERDKRKYSQQDKDVREISASDEAITI